MLPKISVITPSYNQAHYLRHALKSVHEQNYPFVEHIVIDGGSTDGSVEIIKEYEDKISYWESKKDSGQTDALIKGFSIATGDIFCWLNADDLFEINTFWEVGSYFLRNPNAQFVFGDAIWINANGKKIRPKKEIPFFWFIWLYEYNYLPQTSVFWRRDLYRTVGGLNIEYELAMDSDLFARFASISRPVHVRSVWSRIRLYENQKTQRFASLSHQEFCQIRQRYLPTEPSIFYSVKRCVARLVRIIMKLLSGCYW